MLFNFGKLNGVQKQNLKNFVTANYWFNEFLM